MGSTSYRLHYDEVSHGFYRLSENDGISQAYRNAHLGEPIHIEELPFWMNFCSPSAYDTPTLREGSATPSISIDQIESLRSSIQELALCAFEAGWEHESNLTLEKGYKDGSLAKHYKMDDNYADTGGCPPFC